MQAPTGLKRWQVAAAGLVLLLAGLWAYSNSFSCPYLMDDLSSIQNNSSIRHLWPPKAAVIGGMRGRPVANFSFAVSYFLGGPAVGPHHAINLAIHLLAGLVLFGLVRRTLLLPVFEGRFAGSAGGLALGAAALWTLHPLQTAAVTYLSQRTESLMGLFYLLSLYLFVRGVEAAGSKVPWHGLAVLSCLLGMASKEIMVSAPVMVLLYDRCFIAGSFSAAWKQRRGFHLLMAATWIAVPFLVPSMENWGIGYRSGIGPWQYALTESRVIIRYLGLAIWPAKLVFDHGIDWARSATEVWADLAALGGLACAALWLWVRRPPIGFLAVGSFLLLAPTSSVVPVILQPMAENRMYLPLAALAVAGTLGTYRILRERAWVGLMLIAVALGLTTYRRNAVYADPVALWRQSVEASSNNERARNNLGNALLEQGDLPAARREFEAALRIRPDAAEPQANLGVLFLKSGDPERAIVCFSKALAIAPGFAEARYNLACLLAAKGDQDGAVREYEETIRQQEDHGAAHNNLAAILADRGRLVEAREHYNRALAVIPDDAEIYFNRALVGARLGLTAGAVEDYRRALKIRPDFRVAREALDRLESIARDKAKPDQPPAAP